MVAPTTRKSDSLFRGASGGRTRRDPLRFAFGSSVHAGHVSNGLERVAEITPEALVSSVDSL